jgi:hypothetical protein
VAQKLTPEILAVAQSNLTPFRALLAVSLLFRTQQDPQMVVVVVLER